MPTISPLTGDALLLRTIAHWHQDTWGHLTGRSVTERMAEFSEHLAAPGIPMTLVAWLKGAPVGTASLLGDDMDTHPELGPWLGSVFVLPDCRRRGIGAALCRAVVAQARELGESRLFLFTEDREQFYQDMGWRSLGEEAYHGERVTLMRLDLAG